MNNLFIKAIYSWLLPIGCILIINSLKAQDIGNPDSVIIDTINIPFAPDGDTVYVPVGFITDDSVAAISVPITWRSPDGMIEPSETVWGSLFYGVSEVWDTILYSPDIIRHLTFGSLWQYFTTNGELIWGMDLCFIIHPGAMPQIVTIDTINDPICGRIYFSDNHGFRAWYPNVRAGFLRYAGELANPEILRKDCDYFLGFNYPNPFNISTEIHYAISEVTHVNLTIFDILGNKVATLINEIQNTGKYQLTWNANDLPSGIYFYRLRAGNYRETRKMILIK